MENKTLPLGRFSPKHNKILKLIIIIGAILGIVFMCIWTFLLKKNFFIGVLIFAVLFFVIYLITLRRLYKDIEK